MSQARTQSDLILQRWCASVTGDVLSIGSGGDKDGRGKLYRRYFSSAQSYTTSEPEPGCDLVLDVRCMPSVADATYDAVFCSGVLEHVDDCHAAVAECYRILRAGGLYLVGVPFQQRIHRAPQDFWRFTEYGVRYLLRAFTIEALEAIGPDAMRVRAATQKDTKSRNNATPWSDQYQSAKFIDDPVEVLLAVIAVLSVLMAILMLRWAWCVRPRR